MEPATLLNADYLDIIFDKRNKLYGGYELRRNYGNRMKRAGAFVLLGAAALFSFSFIGLHRAATVVARPNEKPVVLSEIPQKLPPEPPKPPSPPLPPPPPPAPPANTQILTPPKIVNDGEPIETRMTPIEDMHNKQPGFSNHIGDSTGIEPVIVGGPGTGLLPGKSTNTNPPPRWVDQMPAFYGDMGVYLGAHLRYPEAAREAGIEGQVTIEFVVNEDGAVSNARVVRGIGGGCDEEALHIVSGMPKWKPGKQNGIPVKVIFVLPIKFVLN